MADSLVPVLRRPSRKIHIRNQFIFYLGKVVNEIPLTIPFLKDIAKNPDFEELLSRVSGSGSQKLTRLLKRIARDRNAKRVQRAKTIKTKKRAAAPIDRLGGTKRAKLPSDLPGDCGEEADYERSAESEPPPPYSMNSILKSLSPNAFMSGGHNDNSNPSQRMSHDKEMSELGDEDGLETRINLHSGPSVFDGSNAQQRAGEEDNKSSIDGNGHELGGPFDMDQLTRREAYDKYTEELAVTRRDPQVKASIEAHCCNSFAAESKSQREKLSKEVDNVFSTVEQLDFLVVKARLLEYLKERREKSGSKLETPSTWTMSEPRQILGALRTLKTISNDANIHRAFGQMKLLGLVESKVEAQKQLESGHDTIRQCKGKQRGACYTYLEELARKEAGTASKHETASIYRFYLSEYHAGERWLEVAETFGGLGIVLIFITAGVQLYYVAGGWKSFQRQCLQYISQSLYSIRGLVDILGPDCLHEYCLRGHLPQVYIDNIMDYDGIIGAVVTEEDESETEEEDETDIDEDSDDEDGSKVGDSSISENDDHDSETGEEEKESEIGDGQSERSDSVFKSDDATDLD